MTSPYACARCRERLPWYAAGTLPPGERAEIEEHLAGCAACHREVALWRTVGGALDGMVADPPPAALEGMTWRAIQAKIARDGRPAASDSGNVKERSLMDDASESIAPAPSMPPRKGAGPSRRQPFVALAAAVLIIAVGVTLFGVYGARLRQGRSSTATATTACAPGQVKAHLPAHAGLSDISMVSATDGWAVGNIWDSSAPGTQPRTLMMRYQHCVWSEAGKSIPSAELLNVAMTSASDGWAFGLTTAPVAASSAGGASWIPDQSLLLHYTHGTWQRVRLNASPNFQGGALRMVSKDDGWLLLIYGIYGRATSYMTLLHYQGSAWTPVALPDPLVQSMSIAGMSIGGMFAYTPDEVWIAGGSGLTPGNSFVARYSSGQWRVWGSPTFGDVSPTLSAIRPLSPHDVWAFNTHVSDLGPHGFSDEPYITHYDGMRWTRVPVTGLGSPAPIVTLWTATIAQPDGSVLALGEEETPGVANNSPSSPRTLLVLCKVSGCQAQGFPIQNIAYIESVSLYSPTQGFALGVDPLMDTTSFGSVPALIMYNAGEWTRVPA